jgi:hypothetical protein
VYGKVLYCISILKCSEHSSPFSNFRLCIDDRYAMKRLEKRREVIRTTMFPSISYFRQTNPGDMVWVETSFLLQFMSCMDRNFKFVESENEAILRHRKLLCSHKHPRLHPRVARRGKLLTKKSYDAYIAALQNEISVHCASNLNDSALNDYLIVPIDNLICEECSREYRSELSDKLKLAQTLIRLYRDLDPKEKKLPPDETGGNECDQEAFIVSRKFITWFRNKFLRFIKQCTLSIGAESVAEGLDCIDFSEFASKRVPHVPTGSPEDEGIAVQVNGAVTCELYGVCLIGILLRYC